MSVREPEVALVYSPREWADRLTRFAADHGELRIRAKVLDEGDALEQDYRVLIIDDFTHFLSRRFVDEVHRRGRKVLGVYDPAELGSDEQLSAGKERLRQCEVDDVIEAQATPAEFVGSIQVLAATAGAVPDEELLTHPPIAGVGDDAAGEAEGRGVVTAVAGVSGGCGATEIAVGLAAALGGRGESTVLVDADDVAPAVAQRLGLGLWPNIRAAIDAYHEAPDRLTGTLRSFPQGGFGGAFEVLPGLSTPGDWSSLRPAEVVGLIRDLARVRHHVVVNAGPCVENLAWLGEPERYGVTRAVLAAAGLIVAVGVPTPVGVARLLAWLAGAREIVGDTPVHVALNRTSSGSFKRAEVEQEVRRTAGPASVSFLPSDPRVEAAGWEGNLPEPGPFTKAVGGLAGGAVPVVVPEGRAKRRWIRRLRR